MERTDDLEDSLLQSDEAAALSRPESRRAFAAMLGAFGAAALAGCADKSGASQEEPAFDEISSIQQALTGTGVLRVADTAANLRSQTGGTTAWVAALQGISAADDGGGGVFYWSTTAKADDGWSVLNSGSGNSAGWRRIDLGVALVPDMATLRTLQRSSTRAHALLAGYTTPGDGGGGLFIWSATAAVDDGLAGTPGNSGTIVNPLASGNINPAAAAGWRRVYSGALNVRWYGAVGDGVADDANAIQAAIDAASRARTEPVATRRLSNEVYLPPGRYKITRSLLLVDDGTTRRQNICLRGAPGGATNDMNTTLLWSGPNASNGSSSIAIKVYSRDCIVGNLEIRSASSTSLAVAVDLDGVLSGQGHVVAVTNNQFENLRIVSDQVNDGSFNTGIRFAQVDQHNVDYATFRNCQIRGASTQCVLIGNVNGPIGQNSKSHTFYNCFFWVAPIGINCLWGSFQTYSCSFIGLQTAIRVYGATENLLIQDSDSETCVRFLEDGTSSQGAYAIQINGGRFDLQNLHADGYYVILSHAGPLLITNCKFYNLQQSTFKVNCVCPIPPVPPGVPSTGATIIAIGNEFPTMTPFDSTTSQPTHIISLGNRGWVGSSSLMMPIEFSSTFDVAGGRVALGNVQGIAATKKAGNNLRGTVTVTGGSPVPAPSGAGYIYTATLPNPEVDGQYRVWLVPAAVGGGTPLGATRIREVPDNRRFATSFDFVLEDDPGAGRTVRFDWFIVR